MDEILKSKQSILKLKNAHNLEANIFCKINNDLGEGGLWHNIRNSFFWVDITAGKIYEKRFDTEFMQWSLGLTISALFINPNKPNNIWVISESGLLDFDLTNGSFYIKHPLKGLSNKMRSNDAGIDPNGCLVYGTMYKDCHLGDGSVYIMDKHGNISTLINKINIPNSFIWSECGTLLYTADSNEKTLSKYDYNPTKKEVSNKSSLFSLSKSNSTPDGSTIDENGNLWNAQWGGGVVKAYSKTGENIATIKLPVSHPTSCTFGGEIGSLLFITSAKNGLTQRQLEFEPLAGSVFVVNLPVKGAYHNYKKFNFEV